MTNVLLSIGILVGLLVLVVVSLYFFTPATFIRLVTRIVGRYYGLSWSTRNGWPLYEGGTGEPTVVLVHGFAVDNTTMFDLACKLARTHRVLAPDMPGFALHPVRDPSSMNLQAYVSALEEFLNNEDLDEVILVGASMGGAISATFTATHPSRVLGLCLVSPAGLEPPVLTEIFEMGKRDENGFRINTVEDFKNLIALNYSKPPKLPSRIISGLAEQPIRLADQHEAILRAMGDALLDGVRPYLKNISCPVEVVWGEDDAIIHPSVAPAWEEAIADVSLTTIPEIGHSAQMEDPKAVEQAVERLVARLNQA